MFSHFLKDGNTDGNGQEIGIKDQRDVSVVFERVLADVGISEEIIKLRKDRWFEFEILQTMRRHLKNFKNAFYVFGSQIEGTTLPDLASDIDILICNDTVPIVEDLSSVHIEGRIHLLCRNETTPAGYVRLQALENGDNRKYRPPSNLFTTEDGKVYVKNKGVKQILSRLGIPLQAPERFVSGPAASLTSSVFQESYDFVWAFRCRQWPSFAYNFFKRPRPYNWPSAAMIEKFKTLGCFIVPVGHPKSPNQETEFRISFSLQERMLMHSLNQVQLKCYVALKLIKKEIIFSLLGEKSLTSYHLKTCMFYLLEQTCTELWTTGNMLWCVHKCLEQLLLWVSKGFCPNYFIPEENMFDRHIHGTTKDKLECILKNIIVSKFSYIYDLKTNRIGDSLVSNYLSTKLVTSNDMTRKITECQILAKTLEHRACDMNRLLHVTRNKTSADFISYIDEIMVKISQIDTVTEHPEEETTLVKNKLYPYLQLSRLCNLMSDAIRERVAFDSQLLLALNIDNDFLTPVLKHAMFLFQTNESRSCLDALLDLEMRLGNTSISVCGCSAHTKCQILMKKLNDCTLLKSDLEGVCFTPCISFLPTEYCLLPLPLRCERFCSFGLSRKAWLLPQNREQTNLWTNWVFIDGKFLLYFMLFMAASDLNDKHVSAHALQEMIQVVEADPDLGHKETCWNILGCVFQQHGFADSAFGCFIQSYQLRSRFNAAILHIMSLLAESFKKA